MRFGVREICDVVLRAKAIQKIGNKVFYKDEPVLYFDSLKTSSLEGAATTVYAQGGRGNSRLIAWEGERTVTFTMEDALISPAGFSILSGAGLISADDNHKIKVHTTERTADIEYVATGEDYWDGDYSYNEVENYSNQPDPNVTYYKKINNEYVIGHPHRYRTGDDTYIWSESTTQTDVPQDFYTKDKVLEEAAKDMLFVYVSQLPYQPQAGSYKNNYIYVMRVYNDEIVTEPFIPTKDEIIELEPGRFRLVITSDDNEEYIDDLNKGWLHLVDPNDDPDDPAHGYELDSNCVAFVDYYVEKAGVQQIDITPDKFGGNYYLEASTLFRDTNGVDLPAEFIIPNCKIQSNFTFSMASSGDPSTFTFTMDAFPDYTRFDPTKKVLASIQIIDATTEAATKTRTGSTGWSASDSEDVSREKTWTGFEPAND